MWLFYIPTHFDKYNIFVDKLYNSILLLDSLLDILFTVTKTVTQS